MLKILGINCSPRVAKSTSQALAICLQAAQEASPDITVEQIELGQLKINGCLNCGHCRKEISCPQQDDFHQLRDKLLEPGLAGLIFASPVFFGGITSQGKAVIDRTIIFRRNGNRLRHLTGGGLVTAGSRNGGQETTLHAILNFLLIHDMTVVSDGFDTSHYGAALWNQGGIEKDETGLKTARNLGRRVAEACLGKAGPDDKKRNKK